MFKSALPLLRPVGLWAGSGLVAYASDSVTGCGHELEPDYIVVNLFY
jgi:hypothetical protein